MSAPMMAELVSSDVVDGPYRYRLTRTWDESLPTVCVSMLNPSKARWDETDPTDTRVRNFVSAWGYGGYTIVNLFAYAATDPKELDCGDIDRMIGPDNDGHIAAVAQAAGLVVAAWGASLPRGGEARVAKVLRLIGLPVHHLGLTNSGQPRHPLYLPSSTTPILWRAA